MTTLQSPDATGARLPEPLVCELAQFLTERLGLAYSKDRQRDLWNRTAVIARELGFRNAAECARAIISSRLPREEVERVAPHLTVGETYFFREIEAFEAVEREIVPELVRRRQAGFRTVRVWSAGCAGGEEVYTLAFLLRKLLPETGGWKIEILGTDINPAALEKARRGAYTQWSFRGMPEWAERQCFRDAKGLSREVLPVYKDMVRFEYHNLAEDSYPSAAGGPECVDIIFCRNVLIYFSPEQMSAAVGRFAPCLRPDGWLIVSPVEVPCVRHPDLASISMTGVTLFRKRAADRAAALAKPAFAPARMPGGPEAAPAPARCARGLAPAALAFDLPAPAPASGSPAGPAEPVFSAPEKPLAALVRGASQAAALYDSGDYAGAAAVLESEAARGGQTGESEVRLLVESYVNCRRFDRADDACAAAIAQDKLNPSLHYLRGIVAKQRGDDKAAQEAFRRAVFLDADHVPSLLELGNCALARGAREASSRHFFTIRKIVGAMPPESEIPGLAGITAGSLASMLESMAPQETVGAL